MVIKKNDDLTGIVSEPGRGAPEVKPARSLWPRPYEDLKIEPVLDEPNAMPVRSPVEPPVTGDFETVPGEGYQEARIEPRLEPAKIEPAPLTAEDIARLRADDAPVEAAERAEPVFDAAVPPAEELPREAEPAEAAPSANEKPTAEAHVDDVPSIESLVEDQPEEPSVEERAEASAEAESKPEPDASRAPDRVSVLDADRPQAGIDSRRRSGAGRFFAIAAGLLLVLAVGSLALVYGTALGGGTQTAAGGGAATATATAGSEDLRLIRDHLEQLEQRFSRIESQNAGAASGDAEQQLKDIAARLDRLEQRSASAPAAPTPAAKAASTAPAPAATPVKAASTAPASPPQTTASAPHENAAPASTASSQPTPTGAEPRTAGTVPSEPPRATETPPAVPQRRPPVTARAEPDVAPPNTPTPRLGASPDAPVVNGWVVRDIYNGMAVLQGRRGLVEVEPGDELPDGNKVLSIRRLGGDWVVVTERGVIASAAR